VIIPRFVGGNGAFAAAVVRALEQAGGMALNSGDSLDLLRSPLALAQTLARLGARQIQGGTTDQNWQEQFKTTTKVTPDLSILTVGGRAIAGIALHDSATTDVRRAEAAVDFAMAERIAGALSLGLAAIDFSSDDDGRIVVRISGAPRLGLFERVTGVRVADAILQSIDDRIRLTAITESIDDTLDDG
jgi:glutathione synthase/RimK-type ligase-like ATP-grasp enzyme